MPGHTKLAVMQRPPVVSSLVALDGAFKHTVKTKEKLPTNMYFLWPVRGSISPDAKEVVVCGRHSIKKT